MNITDLLSAGANVAITITPIDLKEFAMYLIEETLSAKNQDSEPETYLSPDEVAQMIGVSKNTLWRWDKESYLSPVRIGRKTRYKLSDVNALLVGRSQQNKPATGHVTGNCREGSL